MTTRFCALLLIGVSSLASADASIAVTLDEDLETVTVTVTKPGAALQGFGDSVWRNIVTVENGDVRQRKLIPNDPKLPISYKANLDYTSREFRFAQWRGQLRLTDWTSWLLFPDDWHMSRPVTITITVPDQGAAVLPFELKSHEPGRSVYNAYPILPAHGGFSGFGDITIHPVKLGDMTVNTAIVGGNALDYASWTRIVTGAAGATHRALPGDNALIALVPTPMQKETVPWAHVKRGGGSHVIAYVNDTASLQELLDDWTLFHEVSHLYHPYLRGSDRWVSEGFASYFQNVYRARVEVVTPEFAFGRLQAGIEGGRKENRKRGHVPVTKGGRMRTYWTAAAMALNADYIIRQKSAGKKTLASVMGEFAVASLPTEKTWRAAQYLAALDQILGFELLLPMYRKTVRDRYMPEMLMDVEAAISMLADKS